MVDAIGDCGRVVWLVPRLVLPAVVDVYGVACIAGHIEVVRMTPFALGAAIIAAYYIGVFEVRSVGRDVNLGSPFVRAQ